MEVTKETFRAVRVPQKGYGSSREPALGSPRCFQQRGLHNTSFQWVDTYFMVALSAGGLVV